MEKPMPTEVPQLDEKSFRDLIEDIRSRIPGYTPEWTDHDEADPGIALIELFAYLAKQLPYRVSPVKAADAARLAHVLALVEQEAQAVAASEVSGESVEVVVNGECWRRVDSLRDTGADDGDVPESVDLDN